MPAQPLRSGTEGLMVHQSDSTHLSLTEQQGSISSSFAATLPGAPSAIRFRYTIGVLPAKQHHTQFMLSAMHRVGVDKLTGTTRAQGWGDWHACNCMTDHADMTGHGYDRKRVRSDFFR